MIKIFFVWWATLRMSHDAIITMIWHSNHRFWLIVYNMISGPTEEWSQIGTIEPHMSKSNQTETSLLPLFENNSREIWNIKEKEYKLVILNSLMTLDVNKTLNYRLWHCSQQWPKPAMYWACTCTQALWFGRCSLSLITSCKWAPRSRWPPFSSSGAHKMGTSLCRWFPC